MTTTRNDLPRLVTVSVSLVLCIVGSMWGSGVFGGPSVPEAAGGALRADATLLAPGGAAFAIWSLIYFGLFAYTLWQWFPAQRSAERHRAIGWWVAASMLLNALWLLTVRADLLWASVAVIVALALVLGVLLQRLAVFPSLSLGDRVITDGTVGLYLGWVSVATCANVAATLVDAGVEPAQRTGEWIAVAVLVTALFLAALYGSVSNGNLGVGLAMAWGLGWIGIGRLTDLPESTFVGVMALGVALGALLVTGASRVRALEE